VTYDNVGDITIEETVSGTALSGVIESTLTVIIFSDFFIPAENAEVKITTPGIYPPAAKFYISRREKSGNRIKLVCRSRIHSLDCPSDFVDDDFDDDGKISIQTVLNRIAAVGGFGMTYQDMTVLSALPYLEKGMVMGKNCLTLLENIAKALFCNFREYDGNLRICPFEQSFTAIGDATLLTPVKRGFNKTVSKVILTNKGEIFVNGAGGFSQTVKAETPFASEDLCTAVSGRLNGLICKPFEALVKTEFIPSATALVTLEGEEFTVNSIKTYIKKSGLYSKLSCVYASEDEWNYSGEMQRQLHDKIAVGERFGDMTIMSEGAIAISNDLHKAVMKSNEDDEPAISGDILNLQKIDEIKLNPDTLLTESKDLVGALNELFSAAPEGGDGVQSMDDLYPFMAANVWNKFSSVNHAVGFYYTEPKMLSSFSLSGYFISGNRNGIVENAVQLTATIINIYGYNTGDDNPTAIASNIQIKSNIKGGDMVPFTFNFDFSSEIVYEYWYFTFNIGYNQTASGGTGFGGNYAEVYTDEIGTPAQKFVKISAITNNQLAFCPTRNYSGIYSNATVLLGQYPRGTEAQDFSYNRFDINNAIEAFNGGTE
jgi:hypothetical protein